MFRQSHPLPTMRFWPPPIKSTLVSLNEDLDKAVTAVNAHYGLAREMMPYWVCSSGEYVTALEKCVLYMEDRAFYLHGGVSFKSLMRGVLRPLSRKRLGAVSTIDQQVIRLATGRVERTISRKIREVILALSLNAHVNKAAILSYYLEEAYCGYRMRGVNTASEEIFGVWPVQLSREGAAFITCMLALPMPKAVYEAVKRGDLNFSLSVENALDESVAISPRWARRTRWRYGVALEFTSFRPKRR